MKPRPFRNRRIRLRLGLLLVLSLLFQQFALAAYACPKLGAPAVNTAVSKHCSDMSALQQKPASALCGQDCAQQPLTAHDARLPNIPPLLMPALLPAPPLSVTMHVSSTPYWSEATSPDTGIAPPLRFRVLLI